MHDLLDPLIDAPPLLLQSNAAGDGGPAGGVASVAMTAWAVVALAVVARRRLWRVPAEPVGRTPLDPMFWVLGAFAAYLAGTAGFAASGLCADAAYDRLLTGVIGNIVQTVLAAMLIARLGRDAVVPSVPVSRALGVGVAALLLVAPIVAATSLAANAILTALGKPIAPETSHATLAILVERRDPLLTTLTLAHVALLVPVAEELIWRGLLQPGLRAATGTRGALAVTALAFTLIHWQALADDGRATGLAMLLVLALALGIVRERTGSVLAPIVLHALFNAANVAIALLQKPVSSTP